MRNGNFVFPSIAAVVCLIFSIAHAETRGVFKKRPKPHEYGSVLMDDYTSMTNSVPAVVFKHWLHRSRYRCRLCHVDIGFAMKRGRTGVTCDDIANGFYCGSCHDGGESFARVEELPGGKEVRNCPLCHSHGEDVMFKYDFYKFRGKLSSERLGDGIDWMKAEEDHLIAPKDFLEGISMRRIRFSGPGDLEVFPREAVMPDIIFSHRKHSAWSGCKLCHPELFGVRAGNTVYGMDEIFNAEYCGTCHGTVAFPIRDCQRCHTEEVY